MTNRNVIWSLPLFALAVCVLTFVSAAPTRASDGDKKPAAIEECPPVVPVKNADFYKDGVFQQDKAKKAYFDMMKSMKYPIPKNLEENMWVTDFSLGDFAHVGMAGIFWYNDKETNVFAHEIFLLPGQMIVEHAHVAAGDVAPKREAWHVRYGCIFTFGEGEANKDLAGIKTPASQKDFITTKPLKHVTPGELDSLKLATAKHFMMAGPHGAIVTEYGTFHDNAGLRFTNPKVKF